MAMSESTATKGAKFIRGIAQAFLTADKNSNNRLSFEEFVHAVPAAMKAQKSTQEMKRLFDNVDSDGNGTVSIDEVCQRPACEFPCYGAPCLPPSPDFACFESRSSSSCGP